MKQWGAAGRRHFEKNEKCYHITKELVVHCKATKSNMSDRSATFNNAGVRIMALGNQLVALELFRGALESKLAYERNQRPSVSDQGIIQRCVTPDPPDCLDRAEVHLANLDSYLGQPQHSSPEQHRHPSAQDQLISHLQDGSDILDDTITVPRQSRGYDPYVYMTPFEIPDQPTSTQITSSVVVFNLGLIHHAMSRTSPKTAAFYEISAALLASMPESPNTLLLRIALLNNFGVWCYENGDGESMRTCMEHLAVAVNDEGSCSIVDSAVKQGVQSNIQWLLTPLDGGSAAA